MLITITVTIVVMLLIASLIANILLYKAGERQMDKADTYEKLYEDLVIRTKNKVLNTYLQMKELDKVNGHEGIFSKDDEIGIAFSEILEILQDLNELIEEDDSSKSE